MWSMLTLHTQNGLWSFPSFILSPKTDNKCIHILELAEWNTDAHFVQDSIKDADKGSTAGTELHAGAAKVPTPESQYSPEWHLW